MKVWVLFTEGQVTLPPLESHRVHLPPEPRPAAATCPPTQAAQGIKATTCGPTVMPKATPAKPPVTAAPTPRLQPPGKRRRMQAADFFDDNPTQPTKKEPRAASVETAPAANAAPKLGATCADTLDPDWQPPPAPDNSMWREAPTPDLPVVTPVNADAIFARSRNHPSQQFVLFVAGPQGFMRKGCHTGFEGKEMGYDQPNLLSANDFPEVLDRWFEQELGEGRCRPRGDFAPHKRDCIQAVGVVDKKGYELLPDGTTAKKHRLITHLSLPGPDGEISVNDGTARSECSLVCVTVKDTCEAALKMGKGCCAVALDLKNAFRALPRSALIAHMHCVRHRGKAHLDLAQDFGRAATPFHFQHLIALVVWCLTEALDAEFGVGVCVVKFLLDDVTILCPERDTGLRAHELAVNSHQEFGLPIQETKSVNSQQVFESLGVMLDLCRKELFLPKDKWQHCVTQLHSLASQGTARRTELQTNTGRMTFANLMVPRARPFASSSCEAIAKLGNNKCRMSFKQRANEGKQTGMNGLAHLVKEDLLVMAEFLRTTEPRPVGDLFQPVPSVKVPCPHAPFSQADGVIDAVGDASGVDGFGCFWRTAAKGSGKAELAVKAHHGFRLWNVSDVISGHHHVENDDGCKLHRDASTSLETLCMAHCVMDILRFFARQRTPRDRTIRCFTDDTGVVSNTKRNCSSNSRTNAVLKMLTMESLKARVNSVCVWQPRHHPTQVLADHLSHCKMTPQAHEQLSRLVHENTVFRQPVPLPARPDAAHLRRLPSSSRHL